MAGVAAVLSDYPAEVVQRIVDPREGLPSRTNWLPTIAEVKAACEREMAPIRRQRDRARREAESARLLAAPPVPKPTMEEIKSKLGPTYGLERSTKDPAKSEGELLDLAKTKVEVSGALAESNREFMERRGWNQPAPSEGEND